MWVMKMYISCRNQYNHRLYLVLRPCGDGCTENATCWPPDTFDGTAKCKCKVGFSGNGTLCRGRYKRKLIYLLIININNSRTIYIFSRQNTI